MICTVLVIKTLFKELNQLDVKNSAICSNDAAINLSYFLSKSVVDPCLKNICKLGFIVLGIQ